MAHDFSEDLDVFFDTEVFGEAAIFTPAGGPDVDIVAIWDRPTDDIVMGDRSMPVATNAFHVPITSVAEPATGDRIHVVRTGEDFLVVGQPRISSDGAVWMLEAEPG